nr:MAG TPA: hypothetical protein [Caudoviricetes sp.]
MFTDFLTLQFLYCTQHIQVPTISIKYAFIIILTHKRLSNG